MTVLNFGGTYDGVFQLMFVCVRLPPPQSVMTNADSHEGIKAVGFSRSLTPLAQIMFCVVNDHLGWELPAAMFSVLFCWFS